MPLPVPGQDWPPKEFQPAFQRMRTWDAWWSGDTDELAAVYEHGSGIGHPAQRSGGLRGRLARMWWGRPPSKNEPNAKLHVPLAGDICRASADLLFAEPMAATSTHAATSKRLEVLLDDGGQAKLIESAEVCAALGGVWLRPVHDETIADRAWLDAVAPDAAVPEWKWSRPAAVTFWRIVQQDDKYTWRHVERHEPGWVIHQLWVGEKDEGIGRLVPLEDADATRHLAPLVNADGAIATGYPKLTATYVPNMLPNRRWRRLPALAPMGRSDLDGIEPILDALDETMSSWMRDVRLAKGRVFAASALLEDLGPGNGAAFDPDREWYAEIPGGMGKDERLAIVQFAIRVKEHRDTARELIGSALRHAGYAEGTVGVVGEAASGLKTATEVRSDDQRSYITQGRKGAYWRPALGQSALPALLAMDAAVFKTGANALGEPIDVIMSDGISEDMASLAATGLVLSQAQAASTDTLVRLVHPDWSDPQVAAEVALIKEGMQPAMVEPFDFGAGPTERDDQRAQLDEAA